MTAHGRAWRVLAAGVVLSWAMALRVGLPRHGHTWGTRCQVSAALLILGARPDRGTCVRCFDSWYTLTRPCNGGLAPGPYTGLAW